MEQQIQLQYLQETYEKLTELGNNQGRSTWLVRNRNTGGMFVWKEINGSSLSVYARLRGLNSPNLPAVYQVAGTQQGGIVIEEYISGKTLDDMLTELGVLPEETALMVTRQLLAAVMLLEKQELVHRDIQPKNILISSDGVIKLIDFGIARTLKEQSTKDTELLGTVGYAAPEQFGFRQTDSRADIYAIGMVFHTMLTGHLPMGMNCESRKYQNFIRHCIEMDPEKRYRNAQEALRSLDTTNGKRLRPCAPLGFRSRKVWKEVLAALYYSFVAFMLLVCLIGSGPLYVGLLQAIGTAFNFVFTLWALTNSFDYYHRIFPFRRMRESWRIAVQIFLAIAMFCAGCMIQTLGFVFLE